LIGVGEEERRERREEERRGEERVVSGSGERVVSSVVLGAKYHR